MRTKRGVTGFYILRDTEGQRQKNTGRIEARRESVKLNYFILNSGTLCLS